MKPVDGEGRYLRVGMRRAVELVAGGARAARDAAAERPGEAVDVRSFLGSEGVYVYAVVGCGGGMGSHGDMVGRECGGRATGACQRFDLASPTLSGCSPDWREGRSV